MRQRLDVAGRTVLVTGAAAGIGLDAARRLHAKGARVVLADLDGPAALREAAILGEDRALGLALDVTDRDAVWAAVDEVLARFGGLDVVIANAGIAPPADTVLSIDPDAFARVLDVNVGGVWHTCKAALPHVAQAGGHVLVLGSVYSFLNGVLVAPYAMSKAAVEQLARALRVELARHGATAGTAYFGFVDTALVRDAFADPVGDAMRRALPGALTRPLPVGVAGAAVVRAVEDRRARTMKPAWAPVASALRGVTAGASDRWLADRPAVRAALAEAERRRGLPPT